MLDSVVKDDRTPLQVGRRQALKVVGSSIRHHVTDDNGERVPGRRRCRRVRFGGAVASVLLAGLVMVLAVFFRRPTAEPARIAGRFYSGEFLKLTVTVVLFALVLGLSGPADRPAPGGLRGDVFSPIG